MPVLAVASLALAGLALSLSTPTTDWDLVLPDGALSTDLAIGSKVLLPAGSTLEVSQDSTIRATDTLRIEGNIVLVDAHSPANGGHAPALILEAGKVLTVLGTIQGGAGYSYPEVEDKPFLMKPGGKGSDIFLHAPDLLVAGQLISGQGGIGGVGGEGGAGGDIFCTGSFLSSHGLDQATLDGLSQQVGYISDRGGMGGIGSHLLGVPPGPSGRSGDIVCLPFPGTTQGSDQDPESPLASGLHVFTDGIPGGTPAQALGRPGANGRDGLDGTESSPDGEDGRNGKDGGNITGAVGGNGGDGFDHCNPDGVGGKGGDGGNGGDAIGGSGGNGGNGGAAYMDGGTYMGRGGRGGDAGSGGDATSGAAGDAGNGGDGVPPGSGGVGGSGGQPTHGDPGLAGTGGAGDPSGPDGVIGTVGSQTPGDSGDAGDPGSICPSGGG